MLGIIPKHIHTTSPFSSRVLVTKDFTRICRFPGISRGRIASTSAMTSNPRPPHFQLLARLSTPPEQDHVISETKETSSVITFTFAVKKGTTDLYLGTYQKSQFHGFYGNQEIWHCPQMWPTAICAPRHAHSMNTIL